MPVWARCGERTAIMGNCEQVTWNALGQDTYYISISIHTFYPPIKRRFRVLDGVGRDLGSVSMAGIFDW